MFEKIVLRRSQYGPAFSAGEVAEALLFYQKVHFVLDFPTFCTLVEEMGVDSLVRVLDLPGVSAVWCDDQPATMHVREGNLDFYSFSSLTLTGDVNKKTLKTYVDRIETGLLRIGVPQSKVRGYAVRISGSMRPRRFESDFFIAGGISKSVTQEVVTDESMALRAKLVVQDRAPELLLKNDFKWEVIPAHDGRFHVFSSLDIPPVDVAGHPISRITTPAILAEIQTSSADFVLAGHYSGDMYTSELSSGLIRLRHESLLRRAEINSAEKIGLSEP